MSDQERVAALVERARQALAIGFAVLEAEEAKQALRCGCFYADGSPRYTTPDRKPAHRCGR